jgi:hypothetical protein
MSLDSEVAALTRVTTQLLSEVNVTSSSLSDKATTASNEASSAAGRVSTAEGYKDQAFQHSSDAETLANNTRDAVSYSLLPEGVTDSIVTNDLADIFVYDTTKDSDGGAWRYRTQEKSWHDEADAPTGTWLGAHEDEASARLANLRTGSELITNGTFDNDVSGWSSWQSGTFSHNASGYMDVDNDGASFGGVQQDITTVVGKTYRVTAELSNNTASSNVTLLARSVTPNATIESQGIFTGNASGSYDIVFVATTTTSKIAFEAGDSTATFSLDNVSVKEITDYGSELVINGRFGSDISGWTDDSSTGGSIAWNSSGYLNLAATTGTSRATQSINTTAGNIYSVSLEVISLNGSTSSALYLDGVQQGGSFTVGTITSVYVATGSSLSVGIRNFTTGTTVYIDNVSVREVDLQTAAGDYYHDSSDYYFYKLNALGTSPTRVYRGSRKEFPSTAVIVADNSTVAATASRVVIYDGDDPTLPMWMMFKGSWTYASGTMLIIANAPNGAPITSVAMLNGKLCVGSNHNAGTTSGVHAIDFLQDRARLYRAGGSYSTFTNHAGIIERNDAKGAFNIIVNENSLSTGNVNDIAMTVLPNAPIDDATGLPIPTIAAALGVYGSANGGTSVIRDDGTVVDIVANTGAGGYAGYEVTFSPEGDLLTTQGYNRQYAYFHAFYNLPTADLSAASTYAGYARTYVFSASAIPSVRGTYDGAPQLWGLTYAGEAVAVALKDKLSLLHEDKSDAYNLSGSMVNYINAYHTTGWLNGDIRLATLATTSTELHGAYDTELVTNGTFDTDTSNWTAFLGTLSVVNSTLRVTADSAYGYAYQSFTTVVGNVYQVKATLVDAGTTIANFIQVGTIASPPSIISQNIGTTTGEYSFEFAATDTTTVVRVASGNGTGLYADWDNISVKEINQLVSNSDFAHGTIDLWNPVSATTSVVNNALRISLTSTYGQVRSDAITTVPGKQYKYKATLAGRTSTNTVFFRLGTVVGQSQYLNKTVVSGSTAVTSPITVEGAFEAISDELHINLLSTGGTGYDDWSEVSIKEAVIDHSLKQNGLDIIGAQTPSPVATGAELAAYDTFTSSNYLKQEYNSDLDFAGDFSVMCWFKTTETGLRYIFQRNSDPASHRYFAYVQDNYLKFAWNGDGTSSTLTVESPYAVNDGLWKLFTATRSGDVFSLYLDGVLVDTQTDANAGSFANTSAVLTIGTTTTASSTFASGSLALFRISGTALTADQAKKLYEDEKHLFQENAKCTLYGTSSEVKAVAYDEGTGLLHAGTSEGRSSFNGLVRVDEKAGNVGNAISAANGLVVEG